MKKTSDYFFVGNYVLLAFVWYLFDHYGIHGALIMFLWKWLIFRPKWWFTIQMFTNSTLRDYFNIQLGSGLLGNCTDTATPTVSTPVHNFVSSQKLDKNTCTRVYCQSRQDPDHKQRSFKVWSSNVVQNVKNLYARLIIHPCACFQADNTQWNISLQLPLPIKCL